MATITDLRRSGPAFRRRSIVLDGEHWRDAPSVLVSLLALEIGVQVDPQELAERVESAEPGLARERAVRLITARERSRADLVERLEQDGFSSAVARSTVDDFARTGLVDDERFAYALARTLANARGAGRARIARELSAAGIDDSLAEAALEEALSQDDEIDAARRLADASAARHGATVDKVASRLVRRGYRSAIALTAAREAMAAVTTASDDDGRSKPEVDD
jgi:regulatory protein